MPARRADVVVVGGGIAGVSAAYFLGRRGLAVTLLESEPTLAYHTSGRSAALYIRFYGTESIQCLTAFAKPWLEAPPEGLADERLLVPRGLLLTGPADAVAAFCAVVGDRYDGIEAIDVARARGLVPVLRDDAFEAAAFDPQTSAIDAAGLHQAFVRGIALSGGVIERSAEAVACERSGSDWLVESSAGSIRAPAVVNASGAWGDVVAARAGVEPVGLQPKRRSAFLVTAPEGVDHRAWPLVSDLDETWYFEPEGPHLLCSPADQTPSEPCDARPEEMDIASGIDRINRVTTLDIRSVLTPWAGLRTFSPDDSYVIGEDPGAPGFYWLVGQGGSGIQTSAGAGQLIASLVEDQSVPDDLLALGFEREAVAPDRFRGAQHTTALPTTKSGFTGSKKASS